MPKSIPCPGPEPCSHSNDEHLAFDRGVLAGRVMHMAFSPYTDPALVDAYWMGWHVGRLDREEEDNEE